MGEHHRWIHLWQRDLLRILKLWIIRQLHKKGLEFICRVGFTSRRYILMAMLNIVVLLLLVNHVIETRPCVIKTGKR
jgi:hypothetical protein